LSAAEGQQSLRQFRASFTGLTYVVGDMAQILAGPKLFAEMFGVANDDGEKIVEVMGDAARELPHGLYFLRLLKLLFGLLTLSQIMNDPDEDRFAVRLLRCRGYPSTANRPKSNWETSFSLSARHCAHDGIELACVVSEKCHALSITGRAGADTTETTVVPPLTAGECDETCWYACPIGRRQIQVRPILSSVNRLCVTLKLVPVSECGNSPSTI
jgi:hypothetical protein